MHDVSDEVRRQTGQPGTRVARTPSVHCTWKHAPQPPLGNGCLVLATALVMLLMPHTCQKGYCAGGGNLHSIHIKSFHVLRMLVMTALLRDS